MFGLVRNMYYIWIWIWILKIMVCGSYLLYLNMYIENKVNMIINDNLKYIVIIKIMIWDGNYWVKFMVMYKM